MTDINTEQPISTEEEKSQYIFKSNAAKNLYMLIQADVFKKADTTNSWRKMSIDYDKAERILDPISTRDENLEFTQEEAEMAMRRSIKTFVDQKIISPQEAILTGKLLRPSNIESGRDVSFTYTETDFPVSEEDRAKLSAESRSLGEASKFLKSFLDNEGINLTDDQLKEVTLRWAFSHEYAHGLELAKIIQKAKSGSKDEDILIAKSREEIIAQEKLIREIAPEAEITDIFNHENNDGPMDPRKSVPERLAVGFELIGLKYALNDVGVSEEKAIEIAKQVKNNYRDSYEDLKNIMELAKEKGFADFRDFIQVYKEFHLEIGKHPLKINLLDNVPSTNLGAEFAGYSFPLNESELKSYLSFLEFKSEDQILIETRERELQQTGKAILEAISTDSTVLDNTKFSFLDEKSKTDGYGHFISKVDNTTNPENGDDVYRFISLSALPSGQTELYIQDAGYTWEDQVERTGRKFNLASETVIKTVWSGGENPELQRMEINIQNDEDKETDCVVSINPETGLVDSLSLDEGIIDQLKLYGFNVSENVFLKKRQGLSDESNRLYTVSTEDFAVYNEKTWEEFITKLDIILGTDLAKGVDINASLKKNLESPGNVHTVKGAFVPKLIYQTSSN